MKKIFKIIFCTLLAFAACLYFGIVFLLPQAINSKIAVNKLQSLIYDKSGAVTDITGLKLKMSPNLVAVLNVDGINVKNSDISVVDIKNAILKCELLKRHCVSVDVNSIYIDGNVLKRYKKTRKKDSKTNFKLEKIPEIHVRNLIYKSDELNIQAQNINTNNGLIKLKMTVDTPYLKEALYLGNSGSLHITKDKLEANQFELKLGDSNLYLDGILLDNNKKPDFDLKGEKLPVSELVSMLLHFQKSKDSSKKFIENFKNFKGTLDVDLKFNSNGVWGKCVAENLSANAVWFNIPLFFKQAVFNFEGKQINSVAEGILGNEKVIHTLDITKLGTPEKTVIGKMNTTLTKKFNFVPNLMVLNSVNADLVYKIKSKKPDVYYNIDIPANSDLIYNSFYLGLRDYKRKIHANTFKDNNSLYLKEYKYSYSDSNKENIVIFGDGLFIKNIDKNNPDKFIPQYVSCHTNDYAPISVAGSFGEKVKDGKFKGDLKYDFKNNQVLGTFDIIKARHKAFIIDDAHIIAQNGLLNITSNGLFKGEKYFAELKAKNNITGETLVYKMKLFLDKLIISTTPDVSKQSRKIDSKKLSKNIKDVDITIDNWEMIINEIKRDKFVLQNVKLLGSMKNDIFDFNMKDLNFADGRIHAKGNYDFKKNTSKISFEAKNINSNKVAEMTLNLKDQIEGIANAKVELNAKDMFKSFDSHCIFEVKEGFLPKLGDTEFMFRNSKYKLSQITNVDLTQKELMKDDIKGSFDVHNTELKNINITTWHKLSAIFLEGSYEMEKQYADLHLFWRYSKKAPKGARILGIPLSLILKVVFRPEHSKELYKSKLSKIPKIDADEKDTNYYRVHLKGDINHGKTSLKLNEIK